MFLFDNDNELFEYAIKKRVMIVSPSSLICILKIINSFNLKLKQKENVTKTLDKAKAKGEVEFNHVKFGYDSDKIIIRDFVQWI